MQQRLGRTSPKRWIEISKVPKDDVRWALLFKLILNETPNDVSVLRLHQISQLRCYDVLLVCLYDVVKLFCHDLLLVDFI